MNFRRVAAVLAISSIVLTLLSGSVASAAVSKTPAKSTSNQSSSSSSSATASGSGSVSGYSADSALQVGTIVQLDASKQNKVLPVVQKNAAQMYGVVVDPHDLSLTISDASIANETYVATSGTYNVLVSTEAGPILAGDYISLSSIDGVGMDAGTVSTTVLGRAINPFNGKNNVLGTTQLKDTTGKVTKTVYIGMIPVSINIQHNPDVKSTEEKLPKSLERIGQAIAEKPVSPIRIYISIAVTGLSIILALSILYTGISKGLIAIGRNPLSKKTIFRSILEIILTSILVLIIGLFTVYLLLKL